MRVVILGLFVAGAALGSFVFSVSYGGEYRDGGEPWYALPGTLGGLFLAVVFGLAAVVQLIIVIADLLWLTAQLLRRTR